MYDWFHENGISDYFIAFKDKGYDDLDVIIEVVSDETLEEEFATAIPLLGQRKKVALAIRKTKEATGPAETGLKQDKKFPTFLKWTDKALGPEPWKKNPLVIFHIQKVNVPKHTWNFYQNFTRLFGPFVLLLEHFESYSWKKEADNTRLQ